MATLERINKLILSLILAVLAVAGFMVVVTLLMMGLQYVCDNYEHFIAVVLVLGMIGFAWWLIHEILYGADDADN